MNKVVSLEQAVQHVRSGTVLALGGMTLYRRPVAFVRALLGTDVTGLTLLALTCGFESDLLVGAGRVARVRACYFGLEGFGLAPMFTQHATEGVLDVVEESEASIAFGLRASLAGVGFMPSRAWIGTDLPGVRPDVKTVLDPYSGETYTAFPALAVDTAVIHVLEADRLGNARAGGNLAVDRELATVAGQVIVTAEHVVEELAGAADLTGRLHDVRRRGARWSLAHLVLPSLPGRRRRAAGLPGASGFRPLRCVPRELQTRQATARCRVVLLVAQLGSLW